MAENKYPFVKNLLGAGDPLIMPMKCAAGSTRTFKAGEILTFNENSGVVTAVNAVADAQYSLVIAAEEQKAADPARYIPCFMLREGDVFEFELAAADAIEYGEGLTLTASQSQQLTVDVDGVCVAQSVGTDNVPQVGTTIMSKSYVQAVFNKTFSYLYKNILISNLKKIITLADNYTLTLEDCGAVVTNKGDDGTIVLTAPTNTVPVGWWFDLAIMADHPVQFDPKPDGASVYVAGSAQEAGKYVSMTDIGDYIRLLWDGTDWLAVSSMSGIDSDTSVEG